MFKLLTVFIHDMFSNISFIFHFFFLSYMALPSPIIPRMLRISTCLLSFKIKEHQSILKSKRNLVCAGKFRLMLENVGLEHYLLSYKKKREKREVFQLNC